MNKYITHFIKEQLPSEGYRQLSFLTATKESYVKGEFFYGYNGSRKLTEKELSEEISEGKIIRIAKPLFVKGDYKKYLWIDSKGNLWTSNDNSFREGKKFLEPTGLKPVGKAEKIFKGVIKGQLSRPERRTLISH